jgi:hypothetical protein
MSRGIRRRVDLGGQIVELQEGCAAKPPDPGELVESCDICVGRPEGCRRSEGGVSWCRVRTGPLPGYTLVGYRDGYTGYRRSELPPWPHGELEAAYRRVADADRVRLTVGVAGDRTGVGDAEVVKLEAMADRQRVRDDWAGLIVGGLRVAREDAPAALDEQARSIPVVADLANRVADLEQVVADLLPRKGVRP